MKDRGIDRFLRSRDTVLAKALTAISPQPGLQYRTDTLKRRVENTIALPLAVSSIPLAAGLAVAISLGERRNPFYLQERVAQDTENTITITKISSMKLGSDAPEIFGSAGSKDANGNTLDNRNDPRVTRIGQFMRPYELDELLQLWSVLRGKLSLVGFRAIPPIDFAKLQQARQKANDFSVWEKGYAVDRPGLFNLHAAFDVKRKGDNTRRYHWDTFYAQHASLGLDLYILYRCCKQLLNRKNN